MRFTFGQAGARACFQFSLVILTASLACSEAQTQSPSSSDPKALPARAFLVNGVIKELKADGTNVIIAHDAVAGYMDAMTMPFKARDPKDFVGLRRGDKVTFRLRVTETESWIDQISSTGEIVPAVTVPTASQAAKAPTPKPPNPLLSCQFTNELGRPVSLSDFRGQALAITFFFTRCPIPDFCPRLSRNFQEASRKLLAMTNGPANWHLLSVSFDPNNDSPAVLKAYAERYQYDPQHWTFLTGPADKVAALAAESGALFERDGASFNHNFRTLIIDAAGHLQMVFPTSGDLSDTIVSEILKAAAVTNSPGR